MATENGKLYQDRLYGTKVLSPLAVAVMDSAEFQRLAGLRQLGFSDLAFRGATHTRFEHSVGTYFMCRTMMRRIVQNHERLLFPHPGRHISEEFANYPHDWLAPEAAEAIQAKRIPPSYQARWRGLTEVISAAGLIHDVGHVPFGHTLEDEFTGIYRRHDHVGGPRLYSMLFDDSSELAQVFSDDYSPKWLPGISNALLRELVYVILSWKEDTDPPADFTTVLDGEIAGTTDDDPVKRLQELRGVHKKLVEQNLFHPFMSDIVGNTICADLLDYLPRDRMNLGMEYRNHGRLLRYFTIRPGTLYAPAEGLRLSILVTRKGRGGQRRDVATTVLDIMRDRYQMAERVFYHHKKAAASAMLAKLTELASLADRKPRDDDRLYPAPWSKEPPEAGSVPHMCHFSDSEFIDYLGHVALPEPQRPLQRKLHQALRYRRRGLYRTLLVIDSDLAHASMGEISSFTRAFRDNNGRERLTLERELAEAVGFQDGDVLIYCPSSKMQAKEVDARVEIQEGRVLPLRLQRESFAYRADLDVLQQYYRELWRAYVFVAPRIYEDQAKCLKITDLLCERFGIQGEVAYRKMRVSDLQVTSEGVIPRVGESVASFIVGLPFDDTPQQLLARFVGEASRDEFLIKQVISGSETAQRLSCLMRLSPQPKRSKHKWRSASRMVLLRHPPGAERHARDQCLRRQIRP